MGPFGLIESQFTERYRQLLDSAARGAVAAFQSLLARSVQQGVDSAEIEIFPGEYGAAPSAWIYYRGRNNKVDRKDPTLFAGKAVELSLGLEALSEIDERYFESDEFPANNLAANVLKSWLAACWLQAGGSSYRIPVTLSVHDGFGDGKVIVLSTGG